MGAPRNQLFGEFKMGNGYYIIYADDPKYPNGCNDLNLYDPYNYCILAIPYDTEYLYVAPGSTDQPKTK
ncbi:MAG: hypothetical protein LBI53_06580 [Candidatus Peribacteria bacterium]|nr:hypothetical protein [Candidatus Peribacteria bacterium]